jgi:bisphosphoglycerate-independent phosphoglycerate mutase (AlkP superfamily)
LSDILEKKPKMNEKLKVIKYIESYYATFDGEKIWELDTSAYAVLKMCDGTKTVEQIAEEIAKIIESKKEDVIPTLQRMLEELEKNKFIKFV